MYTLYKIQFLLNHIGINMITKLQLILVFDFKV